MKLFLGIFANDLFHLIRMLVWRRLLIYEDTVEVIEHACAELCDHKMCLVLYSKLTSLHDTFLYLFSYNLCQCYVNLIFIYDSVSAVACCLDRV